MKHELKLVQNQSETGLNLACLIVFSKWCKIGLKLDYNWLHTDAVNLVLIWAKLGLLLV